MPKKPEQKTCAYCGKKYYVMRTGTEYCSDVCRVYAWRKNKSDSNDAVLRRAQEQMINQKRKRK